MGDAAMTKRHVEGAVKMVELSSTEEQLLTATVSYKPFDLPSYDIIMQSQANSRLN